MSQYFAGSSLLMLSLVGLVWLCQFSLTVFVMIKADNAKIKAVKGVSSYSLWLGERDISDFVVAFMLSIGAILVVPIVCWRWYQTTHPPKSKTTTPQLMERKHLN